MALGITRREFAAMLTAAAAPAWVVGCDTPMPPPQSQGSGRLTARPTTTPTGTVSAGTFPLGLAAGRDGLLFVPSGYSPSQPAPLILALHGAQGTAASQLTLWTSHATARTFIVVAVDSRASTWDGVLHAFGPDVAFIDSALALVFERCAIDPARVFIAGASDGATYTISLALANGDLFKRAVGFFPGGIRESNSGRNGKPEFFIAHGTDDTIIPVSRSRTGTVPTLRADGYTVEYLEYQGGHSVPLAVATAASDWLARP